MRQLVGWLSVFVLLAGSAAGWYVQRGSVQTARPDAEQWSYAEHNLGQAGARLEEMSSILGSYDGIPPDLIVGMSIAVAGPNYCVELSRDGYWYRLAGPGGKPEPGRCLDYRAASSSA